MASPQRKRPVHLPTLERHNRSVIQFITVCTYQRQAVLNTDHAHDILSKIWQDDSFYRVGRYVIMPDHIHLFCAPNTYPIEPLSRWVRFWKSRAATMWKGRYHKKLWQKDFWDTQLRGHESYTEKWNYVRNNPVRAELVENPDDWPHRGEIYPLSWHN